MTNSAPLNRKSRLTAFLRKVLKPQSAFTTGSRFAMPRGGRLLGAAAVAGSVFMGAGELKAQVYTWNDSSNAWNNAASWTGAPTPPPDNAGEFAIFNSATTFTAPSITADITIEGITFNGPTAFTITSNTASVVLQGPGVVNNSGVNQTFNNNFAGGILSFLNSATAGSNFTINNNAAVGQIAFGDTSTAGASTINNNSAFGQIGFFGNSTAGTSTINNISATGEVRFEDDSSAGRAVITNVGNGATINFATRSTAGSATLINAGPNSLIAFFDTASGGSATLINQDPTSVIDISNLTSAGTTVGSIEGIGTVELGAKTLTVGLNGKSTTFAGVIQGTGGLTQAGPGTLRLTGINTYTGDTAVTGGALYVNGSIASRNTYVYHGGLLGGTGIIGGNLYNHGVVKPGNSPGTLHVRGNYTQYSDGDLRIEIGSRTNYGRLQVNGTADLDGSVTAVAVNGYKPKRGDKYEVLTANGGVHGEFDKVRTVNFRTGTILNLDATYKSNSVILEFKRGSFLDFAKTYNQRSVARALDKVSADGKEARLLNHLDTRYVEDLPGDFDRIAPDELAASTEIAMSYANVTNGNISRHNDELRTGNGGYLASSLSAQGSSIAYSGPIRFRTGAAGPSGNEGKESKESKEVFEPENRWGAFLTGVGEWVDVSGDGNARGYDINTGGFTLGLDYKVTPNLAVGISAGYVGSKADLTDNGRILVNGGKLGLYATYFTGGFYVDAAATGGYNSYDTRRKGLGGNVYGETDGGEISAMFGTGYDVKVGNWTFGPTANVQYTYVAIDDFREHGSLAPLHVQDQDQESFRTSIGFRTSYDIKLRGGGILIRPELKLAWQHEFADDAYSIDARFRQSGDIFSVDGPDMGRDSLLLGAGFVVLFSERVSTYLYYDAQLARTNYESHSISGGVRIAF